jgi:phage gp45-like
VSDGQKRPFAKTINEFVNSSINTANNGFGQILPCRVIEVNGAIVTVNFEIKAGNQTFAPVTCPIAESTYVRLPVQVGDFGICISADVRLGGISGLGQGKAPLGKPSNLGGLVFVPIGNTAWEVVDPNAVNINAPNGAVIRDTNNNCTITLTPTGVTVVRGSTQVIINDIGVTMYGNLVVHGSITGDNGFHISGGTGATMQITGDISQTGNFANTGNLTNNGKNVGSTHVHSGVQPGSGNTGTPT